MIWVRHLSQKLRLPFLIRQEPPHVVAIGFGLEHRDEVDAGPKLLADELTAHRRQSDVAPFLV